MAMRLNKDYVAGVVALGAGALAISKSFGYGIGSLLAMGPGYFPLAVGIGLVVCGGLILIGGLARRNVAVIGGKLEWRGPLLIVLGLIAFIVLGDHMGLLPASFALTLITALADRGNSLKEAVALSVAVCVVAVVLFWWAFSIQFPLLLWNW